MKIFSMKVRKRKRYAKLIHLEEQVVSKGTNASTITKDGTRAFLKTKANATYVAWGTIKENRTDQSIAKDQVEEVNLVMLQQKCKHGSQQHSQKDQTVNNQELQDKELIKAKDQIQRPEINLEDKKLIQKVSIHGNMEKITKEEDDMQWQR